MGDTSPRTWSFVNVTAWLDVSARGLLRALFGRELPPWELTPRGRRIVVTLTWLGAGPLVLAVVAAIVTLIRASGGPLTAGGLVPNESALWLIYAGVAVPLLFVARYPLLSWRAAWLLAVLLPALSADLRTIPSVGLFIVYCLAAVRCERPLLWSMWALMLVPIWLWTHGAAPWAVTVGSAGVTLGFDAFGVSRQARRAVAEQREHAQLEAARRAALEERARIAREMHDVVAHHMSMIAVQAETAPYRLPGLSDTTRAELASLSTSAREALTDMRRLLGVLRSQESPERAPQPRAAQIPELVEAMRRAGVAVDLSMPALDGDIPPGAALCAYRVVQEALANAGRHARGAAVRVKIERESQTLRLEIVNGPATEPVPAGSTAQRPGHGLAGMRERVNLLGGSLEARPAGEGGFVVSAVLPLVPPEPGLPS